MAGRGGAPSSAPRGCGGGSEPGGSNEPDADRDRLCPRRRDHSESMGAGGRRDSASRRAHTDPRCRPLHRDADHRRGRRDRPLPRRPPPLRLGRPHPNRAQLRRQSAARHISRQGSPARWALVEAAQKCTTGGGPLRESYERIAKRRGAKIAKVAVARQILTLSYYGLRDGEIRCLARRSRASAKEKLAAAT